ncbi:tRNA pseudouridine(38-40) synthase TruA [Evansella clarkii]|uniref:tRNA pseudouridine(38-40) synthase TruA n=1 Tax=Evansella clarkii TaxID=79879 RepID=UPI000B4443C5|nr:tRNA pseudouridine(38-40) synthase TruA [Evansella clarkii]
MRRVKAIVSYDGTHFSGYQVQPSARTVQGEMGKALGKLHKKDYWNVTGSGRTDAGVHSIGQTVHFDTPLSLPEDKWPRALNSLMPEDIIIKSAEYMEDSFHARYNTAGKEYYYRVNTSEVKNVFQRNYVYHLPGRLDPESMRTAALQLEGTHDFTSFSSPKTSVEDKVRTIFSATVEQEGQEFVFRYIGSGFLYQMVRILTGTIINAGRGKTDPEAVSGIIKGKDRLLAGPTVPGHGLYLAEVFYEKSSLEKRVAEVQKKFQ